MILKYIRRHLPAYLIGIVILFGVDWLSLLIPEFTGIITDGLSDGNLGQSGLYNYMGCILLAGLGMAAGRFGWRYCIFGAGRKIEYELRNDLFEHLSSLSLRYYNENKTGDLMAHFTNDIGAVRMSLGPSVVSAFDAIVMTVMVIIKMVLSVDFHLTLLACLPMVVIMVGGVWYGKSIRRRYTAKQKAFADLSDQVQESISGIRVIKAFVQERFEEISFAKSNLDNKQKNLAVVKLQAVVMPLLDLMIGISGAIALLFGGWLVTKNTLTPGEFVAFYQYLMMLVWPMIAMGETINMFSQGIAALKRINHIFQEKPEIVDERSVDFSVTKLNGAIELHNLTFSFTEALPPVLSGICVDVPAGSTLAIIGRTGSGKSVLAGLLLRLYNTERGMLLLDGRDIREIPLNVLRENIAYVPQDNFLFSDTIQSNIAFGVRKLREESVHQLPKQRLWLTRQERKNAMQELDLTGKSSGSDELYQDLSEVTNAAKKAVLHDNIMEFPQGYHAMVGERGVTISGGQKQRASIARALMKDAPILILDDALSAVDTSTEEQILEKLKKDRAGKTTLIIAHRISTIQNADRILVLDHGMTAEYGTHAELIIKDGIYARLYEKQQLEQQLQEA